MAETVNLRMARKRRERAEKQKAAAANRAYFGRRRSDQESAATNRHLEAKRLDAHLRDPAASREREP